MVLFFTKNLYFRTKEFLHDTFLLSSCFQRHPITLLLKILGETDAWAVPHLKFWGDRTPVLLSLRPCLHIYIYINTRVCNTVYVSRARVFIYIYIYIYI